MLQAEQGPFQAEIDIPVAQDVIDRLMTMPEFRKAYEIDGMSPEEFITFGSCNRTLDQFINSGWNPIEALVF
jgi:transaldolase